VAVLELDQQWNAECSPGRQTGVRETIQNLRRAPEGRKNRTAKPPVLSPLRGSQSMMALSYPQADARGYTLSPLRGYKTTHPDRCDVIAASPAQSAVAQLGMTAMTRSWQVASRMPLGSNAERLAAEATAAPLEVMVCRSGVVRRPRNLFLRNLLTCRGTCIKIHNDA
jgi:hypothetical protein